MNTEKLLAGIRQAVQADPVGHTAELLNSCYVALGEHPQPAADCGLEVVAWRIGFPNGAGYKVYEQHQPWAYERYGTPPFVTYEVQDLCRLSDATAVIDQLREELAKAHEYGYQYRQERNRAQQELAAIKSAPQSAPAGYVMVPVEPNEAMLDAMWNNVQQEPEDNQLKVLYKAILAAAPKADQRCEYCDGTGDVHRIDGEWLGECTMCDAAPKAEPVQGPVAVCRDGYGTIDWYRVPSGGTKLYAAPQPVSDDARDAARYRWLRKVTPYRFKKIQDASVTDGGDVLYFHADRFDAAIDTAMGSKGE